jgi:hypothetical protein
VSAPTTKPRIESVEAISFRLKVPLAELENLALTPRVKELGLTLEYDGTDLMLGGLLSDCSLRFRPIGTEAMLSEITLVRDEAGRFYERVLLALAARFHGDLHLRVVWSDSERNTEGAWAEVKISRGVAEGSSPAYSPGAVSSGTAGAEQVEAAEPESEAPVTPEEQEIQELLNRARASWDEYQKLKAGK